LLGVEASYDQGSADLEIRDAERLPVGARALRTATILAQRARLKAARPGIEVQHSDTADVDPRSRTVVADYQVTHNVEQSGTLASGLKTQNDLEVAIGASFPLLGGVMNVRTNASNAFSVFSNNVWWTYTKAESPWYRELSVGEVRTRGFQSREIRGFFLTNGAPVPEMNAGIMNYAVDLPSDWMLDAFRGSNLISSSASADGLTNVPVSLLYGTNTIDFVAYGPDGQERMFQRSFHTPSMYVAPRAIDYALASGLCEQTSVCFARFNADVRYGLSNHVAVRAGVDGRLGSLRHDPNTPASISGNALIPYLGLSTVIRQSTVVDATIQPAVGSSVQSDATMQIRYEPSPNLIISADGSSISTPMYARTLLGGAASDDSVEIKQYSNSLRSNRLAGYVHYAPASVAKYGSVEAWSSVQSWNSAMNSSSRIGLSAQMRSMQLRPYVRFESKRSATSANLYGSGAGDALSATTRTTYQGLDIMFVPSWRATSGLGNWWVRSSIETARSQVDNWNASLTRAFGRWRVDASVLKRSGLAGRSWTLSLVSELPQLQTSNFSSSASASSRATSVTQVRGSAIYDGETRHLTLSAEPATGRSGIAGVVFLDDNGDGVHQRSETVVPDVQLYVNNKSLVSDKQGAFMAWGMPGYAVQQIHVDTSSLADPTWIPMQSFTSVRTIAGTVVTVDIPIVRAGVLRGNIRADYTRALRDSAIVSADQGVSWGTPVQLMLHNVKTGATRLMDTFSDGSFYEENVAPGEYILSIDAASLVGTGLSPRAVRTTVRSAHPDNGRGAAQSELLLWLRCKDGPAGSASAGCRLP
ncbi:MAG: hypothetical protein ACO1Q7_06310, partial [Gemmatimonas sp.]